MKNLFQFLAEAGTSRSAEQDAKFTNIPGEPNFNDCKPDSNQATKLQMKFII